MQEKIAQMMKMVTSLTKRKGITDDPNLQRELTSGKYSINPSIAPNSDGPCEQDKSRKNPSGRSKHINMQQRCNFLDKKLKEIEGMNDIGSVDPKELSLVLDLVRPPKFKVPTFEKYDETKCPENHLVTYCHKMARHTHNEGLLIHVF